MRDSFHLMAHLVCQNQREFLIVSDSCDHSQIIFAGDGMDLHNPLDFQELLYDFHNQVTLYFDKNNCSNHILPPLLKNTFTTR